MAISNASEMEMAAVIAENSSLVKIGYSFRKNEARIKVDQKVYRNNELSKFLDPPFCSLGWSLGCRFFI